MIDGLRSLSPTAKVGHIGLYRDEKTLQPQKYYFKMPVDVAGAAFTIETPTRVSQILAMLLDARPFDNEFTRGLYYTNN